MSELIVITGPPGAGKSTVAVLLSSRFSLSALVRGDDFFAMIDQGYLDPWTEESRHQNEVVVAAAAKAAGELARGKYSVIYDGVIRPWFLDAFFAATELPEIHYVLLLPTEALCVERVSNRSQHGFSDLDATRHMYRDFATAAVASRYVLDTEDSAETLAHTIHQGVGERSLVWSPSVEPLSGRRHRLSADD